MQGLKKIHNDYLITTINNNNYNNNNNNDNDNHNHNITCCQHIFIKITTVHKWPLLKFNLDLMDIFHLAFYSLFIFI